MELALCGPLDLEALRGRLDSPEPLPRGLGGTPVVDLARAALDAGWQVRIFTLAFGLEHGAVLRGPGLTVYAGPFRANHRARDLFAAERAWLRGAIRDAMPAFVHAHWTYEFALGALESGIPTIVTAHDSPLRVLRLDPTPYRLLRAYMAWRTARQVQHLAAVSPEVAEHFQRCFRYRRRIAVIPNGLHDEWFQPRRDELVPDADGIQYAGVLNGWGDLKNGKALLEAFRLVRQTLPGSRLALFGPGHGTGEEAESWARGQGLAQGVAFRGAMERGALREELRRQAQVMVHPSLEESFGMTIAESMALGIPVIAGRASGAVTSTLDEGRCGVLTDVRSPGAMATAMLRLARSRRERDELAAAGSAAARRKFRMGSVLAAYAELYRRAGMTEGRVF